MNTNIPFVQRNQSQRGMPSQQMTMNQPPVQNTVPPFGQVQSPPTIPSMTRFQELSATQNVNPQNQNQRSSSQVTGRFIEDIMEVMPAEIQMDGRVVYFPLSDYSKIYAKGWDQYGNLCTVVYVPETSKETPSSPQYVTPDDLAKLKDEIIAMVAQNKKLIEEGFSKFANKPPEKGNRIKVEEKGVERNG